MGRLFVTIIILVAIAGVGLTLIGRNPSIVLFSITCLGYLTGLYLIRSSSRKAESARPHSLRGYYGTFVALCAGIPTFVVMLAWLFAQQSVLEIMVLQTLPPESLDGLSPAQVALLQSEIQQVAGGIVFGDPSQAVQDAAVRLSSWQDAADDLMLVVMSAVGFLGLALAATRVNVKFRARQGVESIIISLLILSSTIAIFTTVGIIGSLIFESIRFFERVPFFEFLFGLRWEPQIAIRPDQVAGLGAFGAVPVLAGTFLISFIATLVAAVIGLPAAIYLSEFASDRVRSVVKPLLEILAGVPTIVYGFFAVLVLTPALQFVFTDNFGFESSANLALSAGLAMGMMLIPFISSLSDDAIGAVPQSMRDGAIALGATRGEAVMQVLLPAALPGIVGGFLLAISRAIGETMIVVMAAGIIANLTINPLDSVTTVTVQIVTLLIGDTAFDNPKTLAAFGLGLLLFVVTLGLNVVALRIVQKYREQYD